VLRNHFFGLKYLNSLMRIQDEDSSDPGSRIGKSRIRDKHPGSATLDLCLENDFSEAILYVCNQC
jgi:hypothetical protein